MTNYNLVKDTTNLKLVKKKINTEKNQYLWVRLHCEKIMLSYQKITIVP